MTSSSKVIAASALLIIAAIGALSYWSQVRYEEDRARVRHTYLVVETLQTLRIDLAQAETGQRGYLLAGQQRHLALYLDGLKQIGRDSTELADLIADNREQRDAIQRLYPLIAARLTELGKGIEVRKRSGLLAGVEVVAHGNKGEELMGQIAAQIDEMRQTEVQLLSGRLDTAVNSASRIKIIIIYGNALAILILLVKGIVIHRETSKRSLAEQDLKSANERLERRTAELLETNTEMESFAYSVAHDLRAPLRHIAGYAGVLTEDYASSLDAEGVRYLGKIREGAQKMGRLVDDLLGLSQIGRQELSLQDTSLDFLVRQTVEDLEPECVGRQVEWKMSELFNVVCDPGLMKQVFTNLLSNAVKYSAKRERASIEVGQTVQNGERVIFVRDNGAGFEMQYVGNFSECFSDCIKRAISLARESAWQSCSASSGNMADESGRKGNWTKERLSTLRSGRPRSKRVWNQKSRSSRRRCMSSEVEILLVEDSPEDAELTIRALRRNKLANDIRVAEDGAEALDILFCRGAHADRTFSQPPKLVLLDLKLPKIDGLEVLRAMRADERTKAIPVVILTSSKEDRDLIEGYKLGVNAYAQKPVDFEQFSETIRQIGMFWLLVNKVPKAAASAASAT